MWSPGVRSWRRGNHRGTGAYGWGAQPQSWWHFGPLRANSRSVSVELVLQKESTSLARRECLWNHTLHCSNLSQRKVRELSRTQSEVQGLGWGGAPSRRLCPSCPSLNPWGTRQGRGWAGQSQGVRSWLLGLLWSHPLHPEAMDHFSSGIVSQGKA